MVVITLSSKEKMLRNIVVNYRGCLSAVEILLESNEGLREDLYHKIVYCKELINLYELTQIPELLEADDWSNEEHENLKTMARSIKKLHSYVKSVC